MNGGIERLGAGALGRRMLTAGMVLAAGAGFLGTLASGGVGASPEQTDAAWVTEETGALSATAGTVNPAVTSCEGRSSAPNLLHLVPAESGLEVTGYRVTIDVQEGVDGDEEPSGWQSGEAEAGVPFLPANTPTYVPADTSTVAWGISGGYNHTWSGVATVEALGPGGWTSESVSHDWTIIFNLFGAGWGECS